MPRAAKVNLPPHVVAQHRRLWARFHVPEDAREAMGKREVWINLHTDDPRQAAPRAARAASEFRAMVKEARGSAGSLQADALWWRREIKQWQEADPETSSEAIDAAIRHASDKYVRGGFAAVERAAERYHEGSEGDALVDLGGPKARAWVDIALLGMKPTRYFVDLWHEHRKGEVEAKTADMDRAVVERFVTKFPKAEQVTRSGVAEWLDERRTKDGTKAASVRRELSGLRSFWRYLVDREAVSKDAADPFAGHRIKDRAKAVANAGRERFTPAEVSALYAAALEHGDGELARAIALAAYTGARREEIVSLPAPVDGWFEVKDSKTTAGRRRFPAAPRLLKLLGKAATTAGPLFKSGGRKARKGSDSGGNKYGKSGGAIGQRFSRLKTRLGHGAAKDLHSIRKTVARQLEEAGIPETVTQDIIGHEKKGLAYGLYSGRGGAGPQMVEAVAKLRYPAPL